MSDLILLGYAQLPERGYFMTDYPTGKTELRQSLSDLPVYFSPTTNTPVYFDGYGYVATPLEDLPKSIQYKWRKHHETN